MTNHNVHNCHSDSGRVALQRLTETDAQGRVTRQSGSRLWRRGMREWYRPTFPDRFGSLEHARSCAELLTWYNTQHRHSSLALLTPADLHYGRAEQILEQRAAVLRAAFAANPKRFKGRMPSPGKLPDAVWINPPETTS